MALVGKLFSFSPQPMRLHSGEYSQFRIDCDDLAGSDWDVLAKLVDESGITFCEVYSVPTGGDHFANALKQYIDKDSDTVLVVDDVYTTGSSMEAMKREVTLVGTSAKIAQGIVVFARRQTPEWIFPIFDASRWKWQ
jgi:hypothetical protein